ncbi:signal peptidase II [Synechococcus sp. RSCCF101]|uniref:signal peptidase II n=1 Tax=Synechococcus sp. RSCCF101 TaxID=2511069 RepID=UPI001245ACB4|nr:signal peptidase II [Synechococcus sp. RSCCF101]QEY31600.1 signal peptidase II [Synechococcus sp. RSCCF101]
MNRRPDRWLLLLVAAGIVGLDQLSKHWASTELLTGGPRPWIPGLLGLRYATNTGAAFSLFTDLTHLLALLSLAVALGAVVWILQGRARRPWQGLAVAFLLGGSLGNGLDRLRLGYVVDYLEFLPVSFPIFNAADVAINLAVACFAVDLLVNRGQRSS